MDNKEETPVVQFKKIIRDFSIDILKTYPELDGKLHEDISNIISTTDSDESVESVYKYCMKVYPERFFDILYQNDEIFSNDDIDTHFLPELDFKPLWKENISDTTKQTIWKYLQLILFTVVSSLSKEESFGDTAKLFEAINEDEFKKKLEETVSSMQDMFSNIKQDNVSNSSDGHADNEDNNQPRTMPTMPSPDDIHDHVTGMLDGKLGKLAKEIADETAKDLNIDMNDQTSVDGVFKNLFKQPTKLMSLVKNVGNKLDEKMKSGNIKESELLEEASELMQKMKNMPGMGNIKDMFSKMGMNVPNGKMDLNAMRNNINRNMRNAKQRERMKEKLQKRMVDKEQLHQTPPLPPNHNTSTLTTGDRTTVDNNTEYLTFTNGESCKRSARSKEISQTVNKKKKRKKKK